MSAEDKVPKPLKFWHFWKKGWKEEVRDQVFDPSVIKVWNYSPRDMAINMFSTFCTLTWAGLGALIFALKDVLIKVIHFLVGLVAMILGV